jgi:ABC-2 type transport system permease protein
MVAQLLRLRLHLFVNHFRRSPWQVVGLVVGVIYGLGVAGVVCAVLIGLRFAPVGVAPVRDGLVVAGSLAVLGFLLIPLAIGIDDSMDPRAFATLGIPNRQLSFGLALASLVGVPAVALTIVLFGTIVTWSRGPVETVLAVASAVVLLATCMLATRVSTAIAAFLLSTRRAREASGMAGVLVLVLIGPAVVLLVNLDWDGSAAGAIGSLGRGLAWTPLGAAWAVPGDAADGAWGEALVKLLISGLFLAGLWAVWQALVARMLTSPGREAAAREYGGLGWFDRTPATPAGVIAARSLTYWRRDARYGMSLVMIPVIPVLVVLPLALAGVPVTFLALLPVPLMCVFLGWAMHNDVAYDHTAIWLHVVSGTRGTADRIGRLVPAVLVGIPLIGIGSVVSVAVYGDWAAFPAMLGVCTCILFTGMGFSSYSSVRFPYPAAKPGDSPFAQPQSSDTAAALVQSLTLTGSVLLSLPAVGFGVLGLLVDPVWNLPALVAGVSVGLLSLWGGVWLGGRTFERRGPEMLASAQRA